MKKIIYSLLVSLLPIFTIAQSSNEDLIDVQHYSINLDISDFAGKTISGNTVVTLKTTAENVSTIYLYLQSLTIDSLLCADYNILSYLHNDTIIAINFETAPDSTDIFDIDIYYHGTPKKDPSGWGGFYFSGEYAFNMGCGFNDVPHNYGRVWFPCNDNFTDKATYTTKITTLSEKTAVCGGVLTDVAENVESGKKTFTWVLEPEIPTYLESVAVGDYYCYRRTYNGIDREIPVEIYVYPSDSAKVEAAFTDLDSVMRVFETKFGAYSWPKIGYVFVPFSGGAMEHASNISIGRTFITSPTAYLTLYYHELSHHWFGNTVTCATAEDMWLNEGWATYCETLFKEFVMGQQAGRDYRRDAHKKVITTCHRSDGEYLPLSPMPISNTYSSTAYDKGASTVHSMRSYLGDSVFFDMVKSYMREYAFKTATSYEFRDFISQHTGVDMTDFFDSWIFTKGFLHYSIDSVNISQNQENYDVTVYVQQKLLERDTFANSNRVEISFMNSDFEVETRILEFSGEYGNQTFSVPFYPILVMSDYQERISDATVDKALFISESGTYSFSGTDCKLIVENTSATAMVRATCNYVAPDDFSEEIQGLELVNSRYWLIESIVPETFDAGLQFTFNNIGSGVETGFIELSQLDSIVLVYRRNSSENWRVISANYSKGMKRFSTESYMPGEYALAIKNGYSNVSQITTSSFSIFPNPANGVVSVSFDRFFYGEILIANQAGKIVMRKKVKNSSIELNLQNLSAGVYFVTIENKNVKLTKKLVLK